MRLKRKKKVTKKRKSGFNLSGYIFGALRKIWRWHPERKKALDAALAPGQSVNYICAICDNVFTRKGINVDHLQPVIDPAVGFNSWDVYIKRLFVTSSELQILCKGCHTKKTTAENKTRVH